MAIDYANGKIYCIRNRASDDKIVYVGSTTQPLCKRMALHRSDAKLHPVSKIYKLMNQVGIDHFHIELISNFPCASREELLAEEGKNIRLHDTVNAGMNTQLTCQTRAEYREAHKTETSLVNKKYYEDNKDKIAEYQQNYRNANIDDIKMKKKDYYDYHKEEHSAQAKTRYVNNRAEICAKAKVYREENPEKVKAMREKHYENGKRCHREHYAANKAQYAAYNKAYRERKRAEKAAAAAIPTQ